MKFQKIKNFFSRQTIFGSHNTQNTTINNYEIDITNEIDEATRLIKNAQYSDAIGVLKRLWHKYNDKMSDREKYRTQANIGHAYEGLDDYENTVKYWIDAVRYEPDYHEAKARQACAYLFQGNLSKAEEIANDVLKDFPENDLARFVWIKTRPEDMTLDEIIEQIPEHKRKELNVLMALASVVAGKKDWQLAEQYCTEALQIVETSKSIGSSVVIKEELGRILLQKAEVWKCIAINKKPTPEDLIYINKAIECIIGACSEWERQRNVSKVIKAKLTLAQTYQAIGDKTKAENNIRDAFAWDNSNIQAALQYYIILANNGERDKAIREIFPLVKQTQNPYLADLYSQFMINRNKENDRENALEILVRCQNKIEKEPCPYRFEYIKQIVLLTVMLKGEVEAAAYLERLSSDLLSNYSRKILSASIYINGENRNKAIEMAIDICKADLSMLDWDEKRQLAILLSTLKQWEHTIKVWKEIVSTEYLSQDLYNLLEAAHQADDAETIFTFCEQLRNNGIWDDRVINLELEYREKFNDNDVAICIMQDYLEHCCDDDSAAIIRLRLSCLGLRTQRPELLETNRVNLPDVKKVNAHHGGIISQVLMHSSNPLEAVDYAYELWRLHPDDEDANLAFIGSLLMGSQIELPEVSIVEPGVAVLYKEENTQTKIWHIIENSLVGSINNSHDEYSNEHDISQKIVGKKKGDMFYLVQDDLQEKKATIVEILPKYLYRLRKCMEEFPRKFPNSRNLRSFGGFKSDGSVNLEPILRLTQKDEEVTKKTLDAYRDKFIPISVLAECKGVSELIVMNHLISSPDLKIKTCFGAEEEWGYATLVINNHQTLVLDMTALMTLLFLDNDFWCGISRDLVITEGTYNKLKNIEVVQDEYLKDGGIAASNKGEFVFMPKDIQQSRLIQNKTKEFIKKVSKCCCVESGVVLTQIPVERRKLYIGTIGQANAETIVLAKRDNCLLWTDDLALSLIAKSEIGCDRVWTQVVVKSFVKEDASELNLSLFMNGYSFTKISLDEFKIALEKSSWQVDKEPFAKILPLFSDETISTESILNLFMQVIKYVWQNSTEFTAEQITIAVLKELSKRPIGKFIIRALPVGKLFGIDCINAQKVRRVINDWKRFGEYGGNWLTY